MSEENILPAKLIIPMPHQIAFTWKLEKRTHFLEYVEP